MNLLRVHGSSTIRIIAVIAAVIVFVAIGISRFSAEEKIASEKQVAERVKIGIGSYYIESVTTNRKPLYPAALDQAAQGFASEQNSLFTAVLASPGITERKWRKLSSLAYQGPTADLYFYDPVTGSFQEKQIIDEQTRRLLRISLRHISPELIESLTSQVLVELPGKRQLIGGAALLVPTFGAEPALEGFPRADETVTCLAGPVKAQLVAKISNYASYIGFGYYSVDPVTQDKKFHELFKPAEEVGAVKEFTVPAGQQIGFYCVTAFSRGDRYYSQAALNADRVQHFKVFHNDALRKITLCVEEIFGQTDGDYQDIIVTISY